MQRREETSLQNRQAGRYRKKLLSKTTWYKKKKNDKDLRVPQLSSSKMNSNKKKAKLSQDLPARSVIFVEHTPGGELAKKLRELLGRLQHLVGSRIKVVEKTGKLLKDVFPLTNSWDGAGCGREDCYTCKQGTEELPNCRRRNIVYESICSACNPGALSKGPLKEYDSSTPSLYVGETARSLQERSKEHIADLESRSSKSHMWKHQQQSHGGSSDAKFVFKIVEAPKSALSRQIGEAIRIRRRGGEGGILNAKGEYNRCYITRLTLGEEVENNPPLGNDEGEGELADSWLANQGAEWILKRGRLREETDREGRKTLVEPIRGEPGSHKRSNNDPITRKGGVKKRKFKLVGLEWGNKIDEGELNLNTYSSLFDPPPTDDIEDNPKIIQNNQLGEESKIMKHPVENVVFVDRNDVSEQHPVMNVDLKLNPVELKLNNDVRNVNNEEMMNNEKCVIVKRTCTTHGVKAKMTKLRKREWKKNGKTGLYGYRTTTSVKWKCPSQSILEVANIAQSDSNLVMGYLTDEADRNVISGED